MSKEPACPHCTQKLGTAHGGSVLILVEHDLNWGDCYTFDGIERETKLILTIAIGKRDQCTTDVFIEGLRQATSGNFQITTDGFIPYRSAIDNTLGDRVHFAMLIKVYRATPEGERRYSPAGSCRSGGCTS